MHNQKKMTLWDRLVAIRIPGLTVRTSKRLFKGALASWLCFTAVLIDPIDNAMGTSAYLIVMVGVNMHPARRLGAMIEAVVMGLSGMAIGLAYGLFGHFVANQIKARYGLEKALAFLAVLEVVQLFIHGFVRSYSPRLFLFVFLLFLVSHFQFLTSLGTPYAMLARSFSVPICIGTLIGIVVNLFIFPELGSGHLGESVIDCVDDMKDHLERIVGFFVRDNEEQLANLVDYRSTVRRKLAVCKAVMTECMFEISYSYLSPLELKPALKKLRNSAVAFNALVGACESEYYLLGNPNNKGDTRDESHYQPHREIEFADEKVLARFLDKVREPVNDLTHVIMDSFSIIRMSIAFGYDVDKDNAPSIGKIEEVVGSMARAIVHYDDEITKSLESINLQEAPKKFGLDGEIDMLMPRQEFFLIASFLMNLREFANITTSILADCRTLVETRQRRAAKGLFGRGLWFSGLSSKKVFKKWLMSGGSEVKDADVESLRSHLQQTEETHETEKWKLRSKMADVIEFPLKFKPHLKFAFNFTLLLMLVTFPAFVNSMRQWYINIRGAWVGFVAAIALESSIGASTDIFITRTVGLTVGSAWGYMSYVAAEWGDNPYLLAVLMAIGIIPGYYLILLSKFPKAGVVYVVSANIVVLSTYRPTVPGSIHENFAKRCLSMLVGGAVALAVQITFFPVKARVQLVKSIITAVQCCQRIQTFIAQGIEFQQTHEGQLSPLEVDQRIAKQWKKAKAALQGADTFREATRREFRLKGPFAPYGLVYAEIIFALHQILDKFQNISFIRKHYGSAVLEDLGPYVYIYRREFHGCLTTTLRAVEEALANKSRLPQFLPSARVAHFRIINRVREVLAYETGNNSRVPSRRSSAVGNDFDDDDYDDDDDDGDDYNKNNEPQRHAVFQLYDNQDEKGPLARHSMTKQKYMSWSASSGGLEEIVEYVEELVELTKEVVGVNEFRFGFLSRSLLEQGNEGKPHGDEDLQQQLIDHKEPVSESDNNNNNEEEDEADEVGSLRSARHNFIRRTFSVSGTQAPENYPMESFHPIARTTSVASHQSSTNSDTGLPSSMQRIVSRKRTYSKSSH